MASKARQFADLIGADSTKLDINGGALRSNNAAQSSLPDGQTTGTDTWNLPGNQNLWLESGNNLMALGVRSTTNTRTGWIQTGHTSTAYPDQSDAELVLQPINGTVGVGTYSPSAKFEVLSYAEAYTGTTIKARSYAPSIVWEDMTTSTEDFEIVANGGSLYFKSGDASVAGTLATSAMTMTSGGSLYMNGISSSIDSYQYSTTASVTNRPRLKLKNGSDFPKGQVAIVTAYISGTSTGDTDWHGIIGYNGSSTNQIRVISAPLAGSSNRVAMTLDSSGYPVFYTGHSNDYTIKVRVVRV